jgi:acyl carrier protein
MSGDHGDHYERIRRIVASVGHSPVEAVSLEKSLEQLGIDSLEGLTLVFALEDEFHIEIPDECLQRTRSIRELADRVVALLPEGPITAGSDV